MTTMTPRQRVIAALEHREPDRVPLDFGTIGVSSPVPEMYGRLASHYHLCGPVRLAVHGLRLAEVDEVILRDLKIDTRPIGMLPRAKPTRPCEEQGHFCDDWGIKWREMDAGPTVYRELSESPLQEATVADLETYPWWPDPVDPARFAGIRAKAERLFHGTEYALVGCPAFNGVWEQAWYLCGFARMLEALVNDPKFAHAILRRVTDVSKAALTKYLDLVGPYIQLVKLGDDLGAQNGPLMSPAMYENVIKPYHRELFALIKKRSGARILFHTCGSIGRLLPALIDADVDAINPVQVGARDMDTRWLKSEFGDRLSFVGAIDTQYVLPFGTSFDVEQEVERRIADLAPGGGYILAPVHNVQADVPPENLILMYRHARKIGCYPVR